MVALSALDQSKVRWYLGYTVEAPSYDLIRLERGMSNIFDQATLSRIVDQILRCETLWTLINNPVEELYETRDVTGYYQERVEYLRLPEYAQLTKRFNYECDALAQSLGARNLRTITGNEPVPLQTENLPFMPGVQGIQGIQGDKGDKGDKGDRGLVGLSSRGIVNVNLTLAPNFTLTTTVAIATFYALLRVQTSQPAWVRLYDSVGSQQADLARLPSVDPVAGYGVCAELTTEIDRLGINFSPLALVSSSSKSVNTPLTITNNGTLGFVSIELTYLELEM